MHACRNPVPMVVCGARSVNAESLRVTLTGKGEPWAAVQRSANATPIHVTCGSERTSDAISSGISGFVEVRHVCHVPRCCSHMVIVLCRGHTRCSLLADLMSRRLEIYARTRACIYGNSQHKIRKRRGATCDTRCRATPASGSILYRLDRCIDCTDPMR